ncbi:MAG: hypothetical protein IT303_05760 [Dehalococcoidia bacterium]|nr:hypothetical protein [Dehalococcoidia bacterium]
MRRTLSFATLLTVGACCSLGVVGMRFADLTAAGATPLTIEESAEPAPGGDTVTEPTPAVTEPTPAAEVAQVQQTAPAATPEAPAATPAAPTVAPTLVVPQLVANPNAILVQDEGKAGGLVDLMNGARLEEGLTILERDAALDGVAMARAQDLVKNGYFDHYGPEGQSAFSELAVRGIRYRLAGENLARNNYPEGRTVEAAYDALMASPGHRANILEPRFSTVGVAAVLAGKAWLYVIVFTN